MDGQRDERKDADVVEFTATDVRSRLGELIDRAIAGERVVILRNGRKTAALIGTRDLDSLTAA